MKITHATIYKFLVFITNTNNPGRKLTIIYSKHVNQIEAFLSQINV